MAFVTTESNLLALTLLLAHNVSRQISKESLLQGLLRMSKDYYKEPVKVVRLWVHECERVLADRMINDTDMTKFTEFRVNVTKKHFDDVNQVMH